MSVIVFIPDNLKPLGIL